MTIRGSKEDVEKCYKYLAQFINRTEVPILKQFHKLVIGKEKARIQKVQLTSSFFLSFFLCPLAALFANLCSHSLVNRFEPRLIPLLIYPQWIANQK